MILTKYLSKEILKSQFFILLILLAIFFSRQLVFTLAYATKGQVPADLVFSLLGLGIPTMLQLILPLSLFVAILLTLGRLYTESEITVMQACGMGQKALVKVALYLSLFVAIVAGVNTFYLAPLGLKQQEIMLNEAKANPTMSLAIQGQFITLGNTVLFVDDLKDRQLENVYVFQRANIQNIPPSVVVASSGVLKSLPNGDQLLSLHNANRTEGVAGDGNVKRTHFDIYEAYLNYKEVARNEIKDEEMLTLPSLIKSQNQAEKTELHWRLTLIFSIPIMALIAIRLSKTNPRQGRFSNILPALLLYLIYFLLQSSLKSAGSVGKLNAGLFMLLVNILFLLIGVILNSWHSPNIYKWRQQLANHIFNQGKR